MTALSNPSVGGGGLCSKQLCAGLTISGEMPEMPLYLFGVGGGEEIFWYWSIPIPVFIPAFIPVYSGLFRFIPEFIPVFHCEKCKKT